MKLLEELEARYEGSSTLETFSLEEGVALVDLAYLVMLLDRDLNDKELQRFRKTVFGLTLSEGDVVEDVLAGGETVKPLEVRDLVDDEDAVRSFIDERIGVFQEDSHRQAALRVLATLSYSDGLDEDEEGICHDIGRAFGFDEETIEDLLVDGAVDVWELGGDEVD